MFAIHYRITESKESILTEAIESFYDVFGAFELVVNHKRHGLYHETNDMSIASVYGEWLIRWFSCLLDSICELKRGAKTVYLMEVDTVDQWIEMKRKDSHLILNIVHAKRENRDSLVTTRKLKITSREWGEGESVPWEGVVSEIIRGTENLIGELLEMNSELASCQCLMYLNNRINELKAQ